MINFLNYLHLYYSFSKSDTAVVCGMIVKSFLARLNSDNSGSLVPLLHINLNYFFPIMRCLFLLSKSKSCFLFRSSAAHQSIVIYTCSFFSSRYTKQQQEQSKKNPTLTMEEKVGLETSPFLKANLCKRSCKLQVSYPRILQLLSCCGWYFWHLIQFYNTVMLFKIL